MSRNIKYYKVVRIIGGGHSQVKHTQDRYAGLEECIRNVRVCNIKGKLAYSY